MTSSSQLNKRVEDLEGGDGKLHDVIVHIQELPPNPDEFIIIHMRGDKFIKQEILNPEEFREYQVRRAGGSHETT
jgi:hypothetical protein